MQNFLIYPNRRFVVWTKYIDTFLTCSSAKYGIFNTLCKNFSFIKQTNRLCFPLTQKTDLQRCRNLNKLELRYLGDVFRKRYFFPYQCTARNFSTNSTNHDQNNDGSDKKSRHEQRPNEILLMFGKMCAIVTFIMTAYFIFFLSTYNMALDRASWNDFINEILLKGEVEEIRIHPNGLDVIVKVGAMMKDKKLGRAIYVTDIPDLKDIEEKIREIEKHVGIAMEDGVPIRYVDMTKLINALYFISSLGLFILLFKFFPTPLFKGKFNVFGDLKRAKYTLIHPVSGRGVRFKDVAGLQEAKMEVMEFVDYLKNPEKYKKLGAKVPKGALLLGPPGCGKTLLAKAVATESNVPFLSMNGSEFIEIIGGIGAARVRSLFEEAKTRAPSIVYIDEIDAIGKKRSVSYVQASNSESERTLNQLLVEMDGMTSAEDIIVLASTNRPDVLDNALLRPGRFDRHILIDFPTLEERVEIFEYHLKSLCLEGSPLQFAKYLAHLTPGFTGAEIANVCNEAALHAASEKKTKVNKDDLMYAVDKVLGGTVKKSSTLSPAEKKVIVYHEAGHAIAAWLLEHVNPLIKVTVVPRTKKLLGFSQYFDTDLKLQSSEHLFGRMCVLLGGRVAENIMFNRISTRAQSDLKKVTEIAYYKVQQYGMSPSVGLISFHKDQTSTKTKKPYSKKLASVMDAEVRRIITEAYKRTDTLLQSNKDKLVLVAEALLKKETLTYKDIESLIGPPPFGKKSVTDLHEVNAELE